MPELKHNFSAGRMNKSLDERLVPNGEYRDATNIQVSTSDNSNAGVVQTLLGNEKHSTVITNLSNVDGYYDVDAVGAVCVGSVANPATNKIYYLVSNDVDSYDDTERQIAKNYIFEYDTVTAKHKHVFVDIFRVRDAVYASSAAVGATTFHLSTLGGGIATNQTGIRVGMKIATDSTYSLGDNISVTDISYDTTLNRWKITLDTAVVLASAEAIRFYANSDMSSVLGFHKNIIITAINIVDDYLFWTDDVGEPKKINIKRSCYGTGGVYYLNGADNGGVNSVTANPDNAIFEGDTPYFHTRLVVKNENGEYYVVTNANGNEAVYVDMEHVTVIKAGPKTPVELDMFRTGLNRVNPLTGIENSVSAVGTGSFYDLAEEANYIDGTLVELFFGSPVDFRVDDVLLLTSTTNIDGNPDFYESSIRVIVTSVPDGASAVNVLSGTFTVEIVSSPGGSQANSNTIWNVRLEDKDPLFNFKFPRFSYRYRYTDGEYSVFAPFSEIAFLPDAFEYVPKKGHNLGMVNQMRGLKIKNYHAHEGALPQDVVSIDILYKETNNPTVYVVDTIRPSDGEPKWPNLANGSTNRGEFKITTEMIHAVVPANQLIRTYDNVPRMARSQEISANRLIYGNYVQNYDVHNPPGIKASLSQYDYSGSFASPSMKSMRDYQIGVVYGDKYGRETPVITDKNSVFRVQKSASASRNRIQAKLAPTPLPDWAEYYSYYVKETSVEYYTLAQDRWYNASDGNIWLSFNSADRNKLMDEDFLILKKAHGTDEIVYEKAKYKILAIESSPPEDIKLVRHDLGSIVYGDDSMQLATAPLPGTILLQYNQLAFNSAFGANLIDDVPDRLYIRASFQGQFSKFYRVQLSSNTLSYTLTFSEPLGQDVSFISSDGTVAGVFSGARVNLFSFEEENKPEFDGKFFVKIYKDGVLNNYVSTSTNSELVISNAWPLGYINNNSYINAGTWASRTQGAGGDGTASPGYSGVTPRFPYHGQGYYNQPDEVPTSGSAQSSNSYDNAVWEDSSNWSQRNYPYNANHPTEHDWSGLANYDANVYADGAAYVWDNGTGQMHDDISQHPIWGLNGNPTTYDVHPTQDRFWKEVNAQGAFFIDAASAWSWDGREGAQPGTYLDDGNANGPGDVCEHFTWQQNLYYGDWWGPGSLQGYAQESDYANDDWNSQAAAFEGSNGAGNHGTPSRGIWDSLIWNKSFMDISWNSFESEYENATGTKISGETDIVNISARLFIEKLVTPGTRFRFKLDPAGTIYKVSGFFNSQGAGGGSDAYDGGNFSDSINIFDGYHGIFNMASEAHNSQWKKNNRRQRWTLVVERDIVGGGRIGSEENYGYSPIHGTDPTLVTDVNQEDDDGNVVFRRALKHDMSGDLDAIQIMVPFSEVSLGNIANPAIWETEPREAADLDIYYQASPLIPVVLNHKTQEELVPIGATFTTQNIFFASQADLVATSEVVTHTVTGWSNENTITFTPAIGNFGPTGGLVYPGNGIDPQSVEFKKYNENYCITLKTNNTGGLNWNQGDTTLRLRGTATDSIQDSIAVQKHILNWNNCWCFGNGVESDRVRDDYNAPQMDNGVKVSATVAGEKMKAERRKSGLIWSGMYNSISGVNNTNQFIAGEAITKDINPSHGSIQALRARDTKLVLFCEDKVLQAVTNRDLLFNADGSSQLVTSDKTVGSVVAYQGDYGISTNPESLVATPQSMYFTDINRGKVLVLTTEGVRPISDIGMKNYFADYMASDIVKSMGTYDEFKNEYNLTLTKKTHFADFKPSDQVTVSYSERSKGWVSFKSFWSSSVLDKNAGGLQSGISLNNNYYTFSDGHIWRHHVEGTNRNTFYTTHTESDVTVLFNDAVESVKSFTTLNYEGSQARVTNWDDATPGVDNVGFFTNDSTDGTGDTAGTTSVSNVTDGEYFNLGATIKGWYVDNITTNLQTCGELEFKDKEGKWFAFPTGDATSLSNLDEKEFSVQGIGLANITNADTDPTGATVTLTIQNSSASTSGANWDTTPD